MSLPIKKTRKRKLFRNSGCATSGGDFHGPSPSAGSRSLCVASRFRIGTGFAPIRIGALQIELTHYLSGSAPGRAARAAFGRTLLAATLALGLFSPLLEAKEKKISRTVTGQVLDADENGIAGAKVELTDVQTGKKLAMFSEENGRYKFSDLESNHDYTIQATHQGLSSEVRKISSFDNRNNFVIYLKIHPQSNSDK